MTARRLLHCSRLILVHGIVVQSNAKSLHRGVEEAYRRTGLKAAAFEPTRSALVLLLSNEKTPGSFPPGALPRHS